MIQFNDVQFSYPDRPVFDGLSFTVRTGEILGILGPNGSGKTTLLRLMRGQLVPDDGEILLCGQRLADLSARAIARQIAVVPQREGVSAGFTVAEFVAMGRYPWKPGWRGEPIHTEIVQQALKATETVVLLSQGVETLSGGEIQRVLLARALVQEAPLLLLDEASSHLDLDHRIGFAALLKELNGQQGRTMVQVSHDLDLLAALCHRVLVLDRHGTVAAQGPPREVYTAKLFADVFGATVDVTLHPQHGFPQVSPRLH